MIRTGDGHGPARETRACYVSGIHRRVLEIATPWTLDNQIKKKLVSSSIATSALFSGVRVERQPSHMKVTVTFELEHQLSMTDYVI